MSDDPISAEELARWTAWTGGRDTRLVRADEIARLIRAYEAAMVRVAEGEAAVIQFNKDLVAVRAERDARLEESNGEVKRLVKLAHDRCREIVRLQSIVDAYAAAIELSRRDVGFWTGTRNQPQFFILCNDTFGYATADAEPVVLSEIPELLRRVDADGWPAAVRWVAERRQKQPLPEVQESMCEMDALRAEIAHLRSVIDGLQREAAVAARDTTHP